MPDCTSCGQPIPEGQGSSCSMCYGDVAHGTDGYYQDYMDKWSEDVEREDQEQEEKDGEW
ncbi:MAG: hypothetical protein KAJ19_16490 [Gammaproteobacteria bacterium]|nr:hypothetical protein [Gammaproteobacteria bacterium]